MADKMIYYNSLFATLALPNGKGSGSSGTIRPGLNHAKVYALPT